MIAVIFPVAIAAFFVVMAILLAVYCSNKPPKANEWVNKYWYSEIDKNGNIIWKEQKRQN